MKKHLNMVLYILPLVILIQSCNKEEDPEPVNVVKADLLGEWNIASYNVNGQNRTAEFNDYTFEIYFNGDFTVNKGTIDSYGSYEINDADKTFTVALTNPKEPGDAVDGAWQVYENSENTLWLKSFGQDENKEFRLTKVE